MSVESPGSGDVRRAVGSVRVAGAPKSRGGGWTKARASDQGGNCVQMRMRQGLIEVRDSKARRGPVLRFTTAEFAAWLDGARRGEFDHFAQD
ncbi:MAG: DUF397 domain-containing protein [Kineosporiaceae bacterium]|jgi:hypothetical protein